MKSTGMRCFSQYGKYDDRICDMCRYTISCKKEFNKKIKETERLFKIRDNCCYAKDSYEDYSHYIGCTKDRNGLYPPYCKPSLDCEKYIKENTID